MERAAVSAEFVDPRDKVAVLKFAEGLERDSIPERIVLELDHDIAIGELVRAINTAGLVITSPHGGVQLIHRSPKEAA